MTKNIQNLKNDGIIKSVFLGIIKSFVITILLIMLIALVLVKTNVSENIIGPAIFIITSISIFAGAMSSIRKNGVLQGSLIGIIYIILIYLISSILNGDFALNISSLILIFLSITSGIIGGVAGVNLRK